MFNHITLKEVVYELPTKNALYEIKQNDKQYIIFRYRNGEYQETLTERGFVHINSENRETSKSFESLEDCAKAITKEDKKLNKENKTKLKM